MTPQPQARAARRRFGKCTHPLPRVHSQYTRLIHQHSAAEFMIPCRARAGLVPRRSKIHTGQFGLFIIRTPPLGKSVFKVNKFVHLSVFLPASSALTYEFEQRHWHSLHTRDHVIPSNSLAELTPPTDRPTFVTRPRRRRRQSGRSSHVFVSSTAAGRSLGKTYL